MRQTIRPNPTRRVRFLSSTAAVLILSVSAGCADRDAEAVADEATPEEQQSTTSVTPSTSKSTAKAIDPKHAAQRTDWPTVNHDHGAQRHSVLDQITPENVNDLEVAWVYHMKPPLDPATEEVPGGGLLASQAIPLVIGNTMFIATPYSRVVALDATTGDEKWSFTIPDYDRPSLRGVEYWPGDDQQGPAIVFGTRLGRLYSLDAETGERNTEFGDNGVVNLKTPEVMHTGVDKSYILPSPPVIYKNLVITGAGPGEGPGGTNGGEGPAGDTRAWDIHTGELVWTFHSVPRPGEIGHDTWEGDSWKKRSGVNIWGMMTLDTERGIVYMPFGGPNNDRYGGDRPGDNLFGSSIVAANAETGEYLWHFQVVRHDIWDYDTESPPVLMDIEQNGESVPAIGIVNKTGLMFFLNRVTGEPIHPIEDRPVPASNVPTEKAAETQPFPVVTEPLSRNSISREELYNETPEHAEYCRSLVDDNNMKLSKDPYTPIGFNEYTVTYPGTHGGVNWGGGSFDPETGFYVVNVTNMGQPMRLIPTPDGKSYINSGKYAGTRRFWNPETRLHCAAPPWGQLVAVNVNTGKVEWRSTLGVTDTLPEGKQNTGRPSQGGPSTTAGGLTFVAATDDSRFRAFETKTGKEVWTTKLPATAHSIPVIYANSSGKQHVAIVATGGGLLRAPVESDSLVVYALPE
ncbi:outer membrane protein assembly factor BamB family protein [Hyphococcus lacteus]|uniref:PQQ-binding-like beta-propeller repeat protein n=1 Tax=Hyphococcus lacteus TaxID=3143536 RepID=A0ABV3Z9N7_9PROT